MSFFSVLGSVLHAYGEWIQTISVLFGVGGAVSFIGIRYVRQDEALAELLQPAMTVGFASAHFPTALLLILAAVSPAYIRYLEDQRVQMALVGVALAVWVLSTVSDRFATVLDA